TNEDLEKMVNTNSQWIVERTGIRQRHIASKDVATSDLAVEAAKAAIAARGIEPSEIEAVIVCTVTPDMLFPATACLVQDRLGIQGAWGFDLVAACSGFVYGLTTAANLVMAGAHEKILVIGADTMSRIINYEDRATCVLFGDGAGAMLVEAGDDDTVGFIDFLNVIDGSGGEYLKMPGGGSRMPASHESVDQAQHYVYQQGQQVFKYAVRTMYETCQELLDRNNLAAEDVAAFIPHQANKRIITATADRLGIPTERVILNIDEYGNTTAATIPLATRDAIADGTLKKGGIALIAAVGAGYTAGVNLWRWEI
ncbi:MAG: ketoacyl-ACP synthase III, partial [bacterium]|nr:ketoacyl-ACP synthase III [bacterium]